MNILDKEINNSNTFDKIEIDEQKCISYKRDASLIKIAMNLPQSLSTCEFDKYIAHLLDHIKGIETDLRFTSRNQFDFVYLCELFKVKIFLTNTVAAQSETTHRWPHVSEC